MDNFWIFKHLYIISFTCLIQFVSKFLGLLKIKYDKLLHVIQHFLLQKANFFFGIDGFTRL